MHNLTDVDNFDIAVPSCDVTDSGSPSSFEPTHQSLSNRTRWLKNRMYSRLKGSYHLTSAPTGIPSAWTVQATQIVPSAGVGDIILVNASVAIEITSGARGFADLFFTDATSATVEQCRVATTNTGGDQQVTLFAAYTVVNAGNVSVAVRTSPVAGGNVLCTEQIEIVALIFAAPGT